MNGKFPLANAYVEHRGLGVNKAKILRRNRLREEQKGLCKKGSATIMA